MWLEWLVAWSWSLDGLRDCIATGIQSVRDCDGTAVITVACLLILFVWYCYHVGREQPRPHVSVNSLLQGVDANGLQNGSMYCQSPECARCTHHEGLNQKLYHNLQEYAKRYSWSGMGRIHKGIREQGRYLSSQPSIQKPEVFFLPDLPTTPYFSRDAQKHDVELLERNFQAILCELVVGGEPQCWAEGRCLLFDDSFLHTAFHEGSAEDGPRVVFMVDLWHPNVAAAERQALDFIFAPGR